MSLYKSSFLFILLSIFASSPLCADKLSRLNKKKIIALEKKVQKQEKKLSDKINELDRKIKNLGSRSGSSPSKAELINLKNNLELMQKEVRIFKDLEKNNYISSISGINVFLSGLLFLIGLVGGLAAFVWYKSLSKIKNLLHDQYITLHRDMEDIKTTHVPNEKNQELEKNFMNGPKVEKEENFEDLDEDEVKQEKRKKVKKRSE